MSTDTSTRPRRFALVGLGARSDMFLRPLTGRFSDQAQLVALCDTNPARVEYARQRAHRPDLPAFAPDRFNDLVRQHQPDVVIVCTPDATHHDYIIRALELGCDVVTEKPMTTDADKCRAIFQAVQRTGRQVRVTFNARYGPGAAQVKGMLRSGVVGQVIQVVMDYWLDTDHGADYFRRWHRDKKISGGMMIHKATHHFDLVNWWIDAVPETVYGLGRLAFYGRDNALARGQKISYDRYVGHDTAGDPFALRLDDHQKKLYLDAEKYDGYIRDRNVFSAGITIEDTMAVLVKYRTGVHLAYTLNCFLDREGYRLLVRGTGGELEYVRKVRAIHGTDPALPPTYEFSDRITVRPMFGQPYDVAVREALGGHGGADPLLQEQLFAANPPRDELDRHAGHGQGAASLLIGAAANRCFETGQPVNIAEFFPELGTAKRLSELP